MPERQTILVIDDEKANLKILSELFKSKVNIILAKNGAQGIEKAMKFKPDVILLDIIMPGMSGFEVLEVMKSNESLAGIKVLVVSAAEKAKVAQVMSLGVDGLIEKPFENSELIRKVDALLAA